MPACPRSDVICLGDAACVKMLDFLKAGQFDLQPVAAPLAPRPQVQFRPISNPAVMDVALTAYWCPYINGVVMPGFVDVPRRNPAHKFVFTAAMNGCAFIIADSLVAGSFRVYHHQHPGNVVISALITAQTPNIVSMFTFADYGHANPPGGLPVAFNFLHYRNVSWSIISHSTVMHPHTGAITHDPAQPLIITAANVSRPTTYTTVAVARYPGKIFPFHDLSNHHAVEKLKVKT